MIRITSCPSCGATTLEPFAADAVGANPQLHLTQARCAGCGLLVAQPQAHPAEMERYYGARYYEERWADDQVLHDWNRQMHQRYTLPVFDHLCAGWAPPPSARVVEIGCGYGAMLGIFRDRGYAVLGSELSKKAARFCRRNGLPIVLGRAPDLPFPSSAFDVAVARHVIEHVVDPRGFVRSLARLVRPGGLLVIETENAWTSQYCWDRLRAYSRGRIPPFRSSTDHTFVFQAPHLTRLLKEAGCDAVRTASFTEVPSGESLHWRLYKGIFRVLDRLSGAGEIVMAVGRMAPARV